MALGNLGAALWDAGRLDQAITATQSAIVISRETCDRRGTAIQQHNLGLAVNNAQHSNRVIAAHQEARHLPGRGRASPRSPGIGRP